MSEKAYSGDVILVKYEDGTEETYIVDMRLSDMGVCDEEDDCVIIDEENIFYDNEYTLIEKVNGYHFYKSLEDYLDKSDDRLLADFRWGVRGRNEFTHFMNLVRKIIKTI